jgi:prepilin-type processing-associated H-X9-DG protein/prepilin-type N-terminal cleavage/methylation domain-containing protein
MRFHCRANRRPNPRSHVNGPPAFTLVELLTSIAIIGVLASLSAAALSGAQAKSHDVRCVHNLREQISALNQFVGDNHVYPLALNLLYRFGQYPEHASFWQRALFPELMTTSQTNDNPGVFYCPAAPRPSNFPRNLGFTAYGYNSNGLVGHESDVSLGLGSREQGWKIGLSSPIRESEVVSPSQTLAVGDGLRGWAKVIQDGGFTAFRVFSASNMANSTVRSMKRHNGRANFAFCDGHVDRLPLVFLFASSSDAALAQWNRDGAPHRERLNP